jgi:serine/threonine protein kinase
MFNDIWSLGIILLNLATGRNPWKSATPGDPTFQAYLRDPMHFLPTVQQRSTISSSESSMSHPHPGIVYITDANTFW